MTDDKALAFQRDFAKLTANYLVRLDNSVVAIDNILAQHQISALTKDDLTRAQLLVHGLAGSGSVFGFPEITQTGRLADNFILKILKEHDGILTESALPEFERLMLEMRVLCERGAHSKERAPAALTMDRSAFSTVWVALFIVSYSKAAPVQLTR